MMTKAAVLRDYSLSMPIEDVQLPSPVNDDILVRVVAAGICHTDIKVAQSMHLSPRPIILGHEGAGIVEAVGVDVAGIIPGDHVLLSFDYCACCKPCLTSRPSYCDEAGPRTFSGKRIDGRTVVDIKGHSVHSSFFGQSSYATHALASSRNCVKIDKRLPLELLAPLGCSIQTGAGAILNSLGTKPDMSIAIFGLGAVGLSAIMAAKIAGASVIIGVDVLEDRLDLALRLGATHVIDGRTDDVLGKIRSVSPKGVDRSLDTSANDIAIEQAIECLGTFGVFGTLANKGPQHKLSVPILGSMLKAKSVRGIVQGDSMPQVFMPYLVEQFAAGALDLRQLVQHFDFKQIDEAMQACDAGTAIKPVLLM